MMNDDIFYYIEKRDKYFFYNKRKGNTMKDGSLLMEIIFGLDKMKMKKKSKAYTRKNENV